MLRGQTRRFSHKRIRRSEIFKQKLLSYLRSVGEKDQKGYGR